MPDSAVLKNGIDDPARIDAGEVEAERLRVVERDLDDRRFDQHLGAAHVELLHDLR